MKKTAFILLTTALVIQTSVALGKLTLESAKKSLPQTEIKEVNPTPILGLYEVIAGGNVLYMDESGRYLLVGEIYDLKTSKNITASRMEEINRVDFSSLPLDKAVKVGSGKHKLAVFYDPDCPYCKRLHAELKDSKEFTIYYFLYPLREIHPEAYGKSVSIWCSEDKAKALDEVESGKDIPKKECTHPIDGIIALGRNLGVNGTPTIILEDGRRISGYVPKEELLSRVVNK
jgi:thiol:disulfide interchange protein DsbC